MDNVENSCQVLVLAGIALMKGDAWMFLGYFATSFLVSAQDINLPARTLGQGYGHSKAYPGSCDVSLLTYMACLFLGDGTGHRQLTPTSDDGDSGVCGFSHCASIYTANLLGRLLETRFPPDSGVERRRGVLF